MMTSCQFFPSICVSGTRIRLAGSPVSIECSLHSIAVSNMTVGDAYSPAMFVSVMARVKYSSTVRCTSSSISSVYLYDTGPLSVVTAFVPLTILAHFPSPWNTQPAPGELIENISRCTNVVFTVQAFEYVLSTVCSTTVIVTPVIGPS